ncbi:hypothetical protein C8J56DRAFT_1026242 [Mycena floridula]|nr:hypothetical protein C8J56DRAFT_1026242 [Mycena floridula]
MFFAKNEVTPRLDRDYRMLGVLESPLGFLHMKEYVTALQNPTLPVDQQQAYSKSVYALSHVGDGRAGKKDATEEGLRRAMETVISALIGQAYPYDGQGLPRRVLPIPVRPVEEKIHQTMKNEEVNPNTCDCLMEDSQEQHLMVLPTEDPQVVTDLWINIRFVSVDHGKAAKGYGQTTMHQQEPNPGLSARSSVSEVHIQELCISTEQDHQISQLYASDQTEDHDFLVAGPGADYSQLSAAALMASHELDFDSSLNICQRASYYIIIWAQYSTVFVAMIIWLRRLHPSVFEVALSQLVTGVPLTQIQKRNPDLINSRGYPGMDDDSKHVKCRWLFQHSDTRSLYRQFSRLNGVKMEQKPHININNWLNPDSASYNKEFAKAVFHYHAQASKGERFEVSVAMKEMHEAAWKYGHHKQILLDGTFGLCNKKLLLFIVMGIDDEGHSVPLSFIFFSAPSENRHTAAGYNTDVLERLIEKRKVSIKKFGGDRKFCLWVAGTDTDLKERAALIHVFPDILLLICWAHLQRSWRNHRNKSLKGKAPGLKEMRSRIKAVEDELVKSTTFLAAQTIVAKAKEFVTQNQPDLLEAAYSGALVHLEYLSSYWLMKNLWTSWSDYGHYAAANKLGCTFDQVALTTNHLESFNNVLKHKYIQQQQHGGRRLRVDVLLHYLITDMLPSIFEQ